MLDTFDKGVSEDMRRSKDALYAQVRAAFCCVASRKVSAQGTALGLSPHHCVNMHIIVTLFVKCVVVDSKIILLQYMPYLHTGVHK